MLQVITKTYFFVDELIVIPHAIQQNDHNYDNLFLSFFYPSFFYLSLSSLSLSLSLSLSIYLSLSQLLTLPPPLPPIKIRLFVKLRIIYSFTIFFTNRK